MTNEELRQKAVEAIRQTMPPLNHQPLLDICLKALKIIAPIYEAVIAERDAARLECEQQFQDKVQELLNWMEQSEQAQQQLEAVTRCLIDIVDYYHCDSFEGREEREKERMTKAVDLLKKIGKHK
jgi:hypothetical protein